MESEPILALYNTPTLIGLNNIGATCFMNSILLCLSQTEALTNYFLKESNLETIIHNNIYSENNNEPQLSPGYLGLIKRLWAKYTNESYSPYSLRNTIEIMNQLFKECQAGDLKDFIIFILEQLHKELKRPVKANNNNNSNTEQPLNQYDKNNALAHFFEDFKKETSIITDIFFGITETTNICQNCQKNNNMQGLIPPICYNYQIFNCLIFPLEEVKNIRNNKLMKNNNYLQMNSNNIVTIYDCFFYNQKTELFTGEIQIIIIFVRN